MSRVVGVTSAIEEIATTFIRLDAEGGHASDAYFFLVGAGVSTPQVKLAGAIEEECRRGLDDSAPIPPDVARNPMRRYSYWLAQAHPNRVQRQRYFRKMIERRAISAANFRLAHLIMSGQAPRLVVTPNFDDFLTRALTLFGARPVVSDHPESAARIDPESDDVQILHVHGTYWFYDCCNLDGEILARAEAGVPHQNVGWRLGGILDRRAPIVIGYSGWDDDVFMRSLRARLEAPSGLPYNLYWFCYRRDAIEALPAWLVDHADVCLVAPEAAAATSSGRAESNGEAEGKDHPTAQRPSPLGARSDDPRLEAVTVLDRLNHALGLDEPTLTKNPIGFFADHLRDSLLVGREHEHDGEDDDVYRLRWTIERLSGMRQHWEDEDVLSPDGPDADAQLAQVQSAVRRSQHREAIAAARAIALDQLTPSQLVELRDTVLLAALSLFHDSDDELAAYDVVIAAGDLGADDAASAEPIAIALLNKGVTLSHTDRSDEAIAAYDEVADRFGDHTDPEVRQKVANALVNKGFRLGKLGRDDEAIAVYDDVIARFADATHREIQQQVARAMVNKGYTISDSEQAIAAYDDLVERFADATDPKVQQDVATAMVNKGYRLGKLGRNEEEATVYDEMLARFEHSSDADVAHQVARALRHKGYCLGDLGRGDDALAAFDALIERFADSGDLKVQRQVAMGMINKGYCLSELGRKEEALAVYDGLMERFGDDGRSGLDLEVAQGMFNMATQLADLGRREDASATFDALIERFGGHDDLEVVEVVERSRRERARAPSS